MDKKTFFAELKTYGYFYLTTAPFTYLLYKMGGIRPVDEFMTVNIFIALSFWIYVKKLQLHLKQNGLNVLSFLLIAAVVLFSIKSMSIASDIESNTSSLEYSVSSLEDDISELKDEISSMKFEIDELVYR